MVEGRKGSGSFTQCPPPTDIHDVVMLQFWVLLRYYMVIGVHNKGRGKEWKMPTHLIKISELMILYQTDMTKDSKTVRQTNGME